MKNLYSQNYGRKLQPPKKNSCLFNTVRKGSNQLKKGFNGLFTGTKNRFDPDFSLDSAAPSKAYV